VIVASDVVARWTAPPSSGLKLPSNNEPLISAVSPKFMATAVSVCPRNTDPSTSNEPPHGIQTALPSLSWKVESVIVTSPSAE
jgi:hypothetical protein